jgi:hypothetical protein
MKTTTERSDLEVPHADSRSDPGIDEIIARATYFHRGRRLGSWTGRRHGPFEVHDANGRLVGIFPDFGTAIEAITDPWASTLSREDSYDEEVMIGVEVINDRPGFPS